MNGCYKFLSTIPNFKTTYVCSDHFDDNYFDQMDKRRRKQLSSEAVPNKNINLNQSYLNLATKNVATESGNRESISLQCNNINKFKNNILKEKNFKSNKDCHKETEICGEKMYVSSLDEGSLNEQNCSGETNNNSVSNYLNSKKR